MDKPLDEFLFKKFREGTEKLLRPLIRALQKLIKERSKSIGQNRKNDEQKQKDRMPRQTEAPKNTKRRRRNTQVKSLSAFFRRLAPPKQRPYTYDQSHNSKSIQPDDRIIQINRAPARKTTLLLKRNTPPRIDINRLNHNTNPNPSSQTNTNNDNNTTNNTNAVDNKVTNYKMNIIPAHTPSSNTHHPDTNTSHDNAPMKLLFVAFDYANVACG